MIRSNADLPYMNEVLIAHHRATDIAYRKGPAHTVQLVVPTASPPRPQSAVVRTLRSTRPRSNAYSNLRAAYGRVESTDTEAYSEATKAEHSKMSSYVKHGEEWYIQRQSRVSYDDDRPRDGGLRATDFDDMNSEDTLRGNYDSEDIASTVVRAHRTLCAADFEDSEDEDSLCDDDDIRGLNLEADTRRFNCNKVLRIPRECPLKTIQLRIQESVLRDIIQQALKASRNGKFDSTIFSKEDPEEIDWVLEMILELMELVQTMIDAGTFQGEEGREIQMILQNNFFTLMRKATRPFRPSGISVVKTELTQCLEAFHQMRLKLLQENPGMSMAEILREKSLDIRPR